jgi:GldM C-terminal domain
MKIIVATLALFISPIIKAQVSVTNLSLTDTTQNILYIGVDNKISITGKGFVDHESSISISGGGGMIIKVGANKFLITANAVTDSCFVRISNKKRKEIFEKVYKVRVIYMPEATLNGHSFDSVSKQEILLFPSLHVIISKCYLRHNYSITSFQTSFIANGDSIKILSQGNRFSKDQLAQVKELNTGDEIYFSELRCTSPDSRITKLPPFWIRIK